METEITSNEKRTTRSSNPTTDTLEVVTFEEVKSVESCWGLIVSAFDSKTSQAAKAELSAGTLQAAVVATSNHEYIAIAIYQYLIGTGIYIALITTDENKRNIHACKILMEYLLGEAGQGGALFLQTKKYSFGHLIFHRMGFREATSMNDVKVSTSIQISGDDNPVLLEGTLKPAAAAPWVVHNPNVLTFLQGARELALYPSENQHTTDSDTKWEKLIGKLESGDFSEKLKQIDPNIVTKDLNWLWEFFGEDYSHWLHFQLKLKYLELSKKANIEVSNLLEVQLPADYCTSKYFDELLHDSFKASSGRGNKKLSRGTMQRLRPLDLFILNSISTHTNIVFVPVALLDGKIQKLEVHSTVAQGACRIFVCLSNWDTDPVFLFSTAPILKARQRLLDGPLHSLKTMHCVISRRLLLNNVPLERVMKSTTAAIATYDFPSHETFSIANKRTESFIDEETIFSVAVRGMCPGLLLLATGVAVNKDTKTWCYVPMPYVNRLIENDRRVKMFQESNIADMFSMRPSRHMEHQHLAFYPYSISNSENHGRALIDIGSTGAGAAATRFEGKPMTTGLSYDSVDSFYRAFISQTMSQPILEEMKDPSGRLSMVAAIFETIQEHPLFGGFQTIDHYEAMLNHLLNVWESRKQGAVKEYLKRIELRCWNSMSQTVLLIKTLWVSLGFPILATLQGSGRMYCANQCLLDPKDEKAVLDDQNQVPPGYRAKKWTAEFFGLNQVLCEDSEMKLRSISMGFQGTAETLGLLSLKVILVHLCDATAIDILSHEGGLDLKLLHNTQMEKLISQISSFKKSHGSFKTFLGTTTIESKKLKDKKAHTFHVPKPGQYRAGNDIPLKLQLLCSFLKGTMKVNFLKDEGIICTSPHEAMKRFLMSDDSLDRPKWIPSMQDEAKHCTTIIKWLLGFEYGVVKCIVEKVSDAFFELHHPGTLQRKGKNLAKFTVSRNWHKEWLYSFLREVIVFYGISVECPWPDLQEVSILFRSIGAEKMKAQQKAETHLWRAAHYLEESQGKDFECNLFGVVAFVILHIGASKSLGCVEFFANNDKDECLDLAACLRKVCPLIKLEDKYLSMFELTKHLLDPKSDFGKSAAAQVEEVLKHNFRNRNVALEVEELFFPDEPRKKGGNLLHEILTSSGKIELGDLEEPPSQIGVCEKMFSLGDVVCEESDEKVVLKRSFGPAECQWNYEAYYGTVPSGLLNSVTEHFDSEEFDEILKHEQKTSLQHFEWRNAEIIEGCHAAEFLKSTNASRSEAEKNLMGAISQALKAYGLDPGNSLTFKECSIIWPLGTKVGIVHEIPHIEYTTFAKFEERNKKNLGLLGYMPLQKDGCTIRVDVIHEMYAQKPVDDWEQGCRHPIAGYVYVFIPHGSLLLLNARQFKGGTYGEKSAKFLSFTFANVEISSERLMLREGGYRLPRCQTEMDAIKQFLKDSKKSSKAKRCKHSNEGPKVCSKTSKDDSVMNVANSIFSLHNLAEIALEHRLCHEDDEEVKLQRLEPRMIKAEEHAFHTSFFCKVPKLMFDTTVRHFGSIVYSQSFMHRGNLIDHFDWGTLTKVEERHGKYLMSGSKSDAETRIMKSIQESLEEKTKMNVASSNCGTICTLNGAVHQISHVDNKESLKEKNEAFIGHMALDEEGCTIRLDLALRGNEKAVSRFCYIYIPVGYLLLVNAKIYHGGNYGTSNVRRFHCYFASFSWPVGKKDNFHFPIARPPKCSPEIATIDQFMKECIMQMKDLAAESAVASSEVSHGFSETTTRRTVVETAPSKEEQPKRRQQPSRNNTVVRETWTDLAPKTVVASSELSGKTVVQTTPSTGEHRPKKRKQPTASDNMGVGVDASGTTVFQTTTEERAQPKKRRKPTRRQLPRRGLKQPAKLPEDKVKTPKKAKLVNETDSDLVESEDESVANGETTEDPSDYIIVGKDENKFNTGQDQDESVALKEATYFGNFTAYYCAYLPPKRYAPVVAASNHSSSKLRLDIHGTGIVVQNWQGDAKEGGPIHGEYYMCGRGKTQAHTAAGQLMTEIKKSLEAKTRTSFCYCDWGLIRTINGQYHQPPHIDHPLAYSRRIGKVAPKAYTGMMALDPEGCTLRLDTIREDLIESKECADNEFYSENGDEATIKHHTYVFVPYGAVLLIDSRQFHGGHYGSNNKLRLHFVFANWDWEATFVGGQERLLRLARGLPQPVPAELKAILQKMASENENLRNKRSPYVTACDKVTKEIENVDKSQFEFINEAHPKFREQLNKIHKSVDENGEIKYTPQHVCRPLVAFLKLRLPLNFTPSLFKYRNFNDASETWKCESTSKDTTWVAVVVLTGEFWTLLAHPNKYMIPPEAVHTQEYEDWRTKKGDIAKEVVKFEKKKWDEKDHHLVAVNGKPGSILKFPANEWEYLVIAQRKNSSLLFIDESANKT